jgi:hypothetical protein
MKSLKIVLAMVITGASLLSASAKEAKLQLWMSATPANPIVGEEVTWSVITTGGNTCPSFVWNSSNQTETPALYNWTGSSYPLYHTQTMKFVYGTSGPKTITVTASSGTEEVTRTLGLEVLEGRITLITPNGGEVWKVGKTYPIRWKTEGNVPLVQISIFDDRYPTETGHSGQEVIAYETANTGTFFYKVPGPRADGISTGNLGGRNYKVSVVGFVSNFGGISASKFTIKK